MEIPTPGAAVNFPEGNWKVDTLKEYFDVRIAALDEMIKTRLSTKKEFFNMRIDDLEKCIEVDNIASKKALEAALAAVKEENNKAERAINLRLESMNEFRKSLEDLNKTFATQSETEIRFKGMEERITRFDLRLESIGGKDLGSDRTRMMVFQIIATIGLLVSLGFGLFTLMTAS